MCSGTCVQLSINDMRKTLVSIFFLSAWFPCTAIAEADKKLWELEKISGSEIENGEGRLMRLRTCHDVFMVQCEPCEIIRIVNVSYAASQLQQRNPIQECSDINFQHEFDCLRPDQYQYIQQVKGSCDGIQSCELKRDSSDVPCGSFKRTWSCCVEIYYSCEPKSDLIQSAFFSATDLYGNVNNVYLQCQSSDLSVDSVVLEFSSSEEAKDGEFCYIVSPNVDSLKRDCVRSGCSGIYVRGDRGCGGNQNISNHGIYVCYICKNRQLHQTIPVASQSSAFGRTTIRQSISSKAATTPNRSTTRPTTTMQSSTETNGQYESQGTSNETTSPLSAEIGSATETASLSTTNSSATTPLTESTCTTATKPSTSTEFVTTTASPSTVQSSTNTTYSESTVFAETAVTWERTQSATGTSTNTISKTEWNIYWLNGADIRVVGGASLVVVVLLCLFVGHIIIGRRRRRIRRSEIRRIGKSCRDQQFENVTIQDETTCATPYQEDDEDQTFETEFNRYSYATVPGENNLETSQYCEVVDLQDALKQRKYYSPERTRDNEVSRKAIKETKLTAIRETPNNSPALGKKLDHNILIESMLNLKPVFSDGVNHSKQDKSKLVNQNLDSPSYVREPAHIVLTQEPTTMYTEVNRSKQKLKPVSKTPGLHPVRNDPDADYVLLKEEPTASYTVVNRSKQNLKPVSKQVGSPRNEIDADYALLKEEPAPTHSEVNSLKENAKPIPKNVGLHPVRNGQESDNSLLKVEPTVTYTDVTSSKQTRKMVHQNVHPLGKDPGPVYDELRQPGVDLIQMSSKVDSPKVKPKPPPKKPDSPKKNSKPFFSQLRRSIKGVTGSGAKVQLPVSKPPGENKMATCEDDEPETYATYCGTRDTYDGCLSDNDLYG